MISDDIEDDASDAVTATIDLTDREAVSENVKESRETPVGIGRGRL